MEFFILTIGDIYNDGHGQTDGVLVYNGSMADFASALSDFEKKHSFRFKEEFREYEWNTESEKLGLLKKEVGFEQEGGDYENWSSDEYLEFMVHCANTMGHSFKIAYRNELNLSIAYGLFYS